MYVYYDKDTERLEITVTKSTSLSKHEFVNIPDDGTEVHKSFSIVACKMFCLGFMIGSRHNPLKIKNDVTEFQ